MKIKWVCIIGFVFLFVSMACVSAEDNATAVEMPQEDVIEESPSVVEDINVTFEEQMWKENLSDIEVELPEEASGDFSVKINDEIIYNETITSHSFKVPIKLPKDKFIYIANIFPPLDMKVYKVSAFYNGIDLNLNRTLKVMSYPPDYDFIHFPDEVLQSKENPPVMIFPRSANGTVEFYVDDRLINRTVAKPIFYWESNPFSALSLGNHTLRVSYLGDSYYRPFNKTFNFTVTNVIISIPKIVNIGHDDCISLEAATTYPGLVKVYIDGKLVKSAKAYDGEFLMSLEGFIKYTNHEITVVYEGKTISRNKTQQVNMTYDFDVWPMVFTYGDKNSIEVMLPDTLNNRLLTVTINGTEYSFKHEENIANNIVEVDISKLDAGNYSMFVSFKGDDTFYALNRTYNFTVDYGFHIPSEIEYKDSSKISLKLPADANGDLMIYVNGKLFKSVKLNKGYAEIGLSSLEPNEYDVCIRYNGDDYNVSEVNDTLEVLPKITLTYRFTAGDDKYITVQVPKTTQGYVVFEIDGKSYKVNIKNGIAKLSLKNLNPGEHDIFIDYYGANGFKDFSNWRVVTVSKAKIKLLSAQATFRGVDAKVKLLKKDGSAFASKTVAVKFNGKTYKIKTDKNGILTFKKSMNLKKKKYALTVTYMGVKLTKKLKVKPIAVKATKTKGKLIIKASINKKIKNRIVKIKVNSKTFKVKTNSGGMAKLIIKKPANAVKIKAAYMKSSVKISV